jgi:hypothetical protein
MRRLMRPALEYREAVSTALQNVADTVNALQFDSHVVEANEHATACTLRSNCSALSSQPERFLGSSTQG